MPERIVIRKKKAADRFVTVYRNGKIDLETDDIRQYTMYVGLRALEGFQVVKQSDLVVVLEKPSP